VRLDEKTRRAAVEAVWRIVKNTHWDPGFGGVDWDGVYRRFLPLGLKAPTEAAFWATLQEMVDQLKQSHFVVLAPGAFTGAEAGGRRREGGGWSGARLVLTKDGVLVGAVRDGSPAAEAGLTPGMIVESIGSSPLEKSLGPLVARKARPVELALALRALESGGVGETLVWRVVDAAGRALNLSVRYGAPPGKVVRQLGLPATNVDSESRILKNDGIWYFRYNIFLLPNQQAFMEALARVENRSAPGLILDLRGNPGGVIFMTWGIANRLALWSGSLGNMRQKSATLRFPVTIPEDEPAPFKGPVAVLTDELSLSCSEVLAGGLQEMGRVKVVGRTTGGMVLPAQISLLPGGARLEHAIADFKTPKGIYLEGRGVIPDIPVALTRKALLADPDPDLTAARNWIASKRGTLKT
jgi:carboxyl-terminal processing protease